MLPSAEDHVAITDLLARYCLALDLGDVEGWLALFTPEARYEVYGRAFEGHAGLRAMVTAAPGGLHLGGPPSVEMIDRDRARTRRNLLFVERATGASRSAVYTDELQRTEGGWRIARCRCQFIVKEGLADRPEKETR
jgi:hypothetical protein